MAKRKDIEVVVECSDGSGAWRPLKETDTAESVKEEANSQKRSTTAIEATPGFFRLAISTSKKDSDWGSNNGLRIVITFDQGYQLREYPILVLKPEDDADELAAKLNVDVMDRCPKTDQLRFFLDSVYLPIVDQPQQPFCKAQFVFKKLKPSSLKDLKPFAEHPADLAKLKVEVTPCKIHDFGRSRPTKLKTLNGTEEEREQAREVAREQGLRLETNLNWNINQKCGATFRYGFKYNKCSVSQRCTFLFLYREVGSYERLEDVDIVDHNEAHSTSNPYYGQRRSSNLKRPSERVFDLREPETAVSLSSSSSDSNTGRQTSTSRSEASPSSHTSDSTILPPKNDREVSDFGQVNASHAFNDGGDISLSLLSVCLLESSPMVKAALNAEHCRQKKQKNDRKKLELLKDQIIVSSMEMRKTGDRLNEAEILVQNLKTEKHNREQENAKIQQQIEETETALQREKDPDSAVNMSHDRALAAINEYGNMHQEGSTDSAGIVNNTRKRKRNDSLSIC